VWLRDRDVEPLMRERYLDAINRAVPDDPDATPRPIETFWVVGPIEKFDMTVSDWGDRVTVHVFIPQRLADDAQAAARSYSD
jgi:hypothetical protein